MMKKVKFIWCAILLMVFTVSAYANNNPLIGSWAFSVPDAPWELSRGSMVFEITDDNVVTGKMKFIGGYEARILNVNQVDEKIVFEITAESYRLKTTVTLKDNDIQGFVETPEYNIPFSAKRELPES